jgi:hypothetical protein
MSAIAGIQDRSRNQTVIDPTHNIVIKKYKSDDEHVKDVKHVKHVKHVNNGHMLINDNGSQYYIIKAFLHKIVKVPTPIFLSII